MVMQVILVDRVVRMGGEIGVLGMAGWVKVMQVIWLERVLIEEGIEVVGMAG